MSAVFEYEDDPDEKSRICKMVLDDLPLWFGMPESNEEYRAGVADKAFIKILDGGDVIGFASVKDNNADVSEIYVMGILAMHHRRGIGQQLFAFIEAAERGKGKRYLEVKTLAAERESEEYRLTRLFYAKVGFIPLDVLRNEWGPSNPCLVMIKAI
jgi:GNAT superfamily N-acetyltransferase